MAGSPYPKDGKRDAPWTRTAASSGETPHRPGGGWLTALIFLPPAVVLFTIFVVMPMGEAAWYSFYNWNGYGRPENFIGFKNYFWLFGNTAFLRALINNGLIIIVSL